MHSFRHAIRTITVTSAAALLFTGVAFGQSYKAEAEKPVFEDLPSPEFGGTKNKTFKPKDWLELETKLKIQMAPPPPSKTLERMTVKWYVAIENPEKRGTYLLLTKDIEHVNVPLEEDVYTSVYLSPASVKRVTGSDKGGKAAVKAIGIEVLINGTKVAQQTQGLKENWWNTPSNSISRSDTVPLLNKAETPFAQMWWDRYAEIQQERR